jgi:anti-sigma regulatory factor (Ser/Thr protein kinase)
MLEPIDYATRPAFIAAGPPAFRLVGRCASAPPAVGPGENYTRAELRPEAAAAAQARHLTRVVLACWQLNHLADEAEIIASELATNAFIAAVPPHATLPAIIFAVHRRPDELRIIVWDNGPGRPCVAEPGPDAEAGRGLAIVGDLTGWNWGWWPTPHTGGKVVWAALPLNPDHTTPSPA